MTLHKSHYTFLGIGSNLADKKKNIAHALELIETEVGAILKESRTFVSKAEGFDSVNEFFNKVVLVTTKFSPFALIEEIEEIERIVGRKNKSINREYKDRIIDIDILYFDDLILDNEQLTIPHIENKNREFVLQPLSEIAGEYLDPREKKTVKELLQILKSK